MKSVFSLFLLVPSAIAIISAEPTNWDGPNRHLQEPSSFQRKLETRIESYSTSGGTFASTLIDLAYQFQLPTGIEYVDHRAITETMDLEFHNETVRTILTQIVGQLPEYRVDFRDGLVDVYASKALGDDANLLNKVIKNFQVTDADTHRADMELTCSLARELVPPGGCGGSIATGQWGALRLTIHLRDATVREILNSIVAQNGKAVWIVMVPPGRLTRPQFGGLWHIYPLELPYKSAVLSRLSSIDGPSLTTP